MQYYVIKFVINLHQVLGFLRVLRFPLPNKTDRHDITDILLKVALNTITQTQHHKDKLISGSFIAYDARPGFQMFYPKIVSVFLSRVRHTS
jgi:hypothetical protein